MPIIAGLIFALTTASVPIGASDGRTLPPFAVVATSGATIASDRLNASDHWLLVLVTPDCVPCERLLRALDGWNIANLGQRVVVIVGGPREAVDGRVRPWLSTSGAGLSIFADPDATAAAALRVTQTPTLIGVKGREIAWSISGVLNDPKMIESVVTRWIEG